jgi:hypothetical protein
VCFTQMPYNDTNETSGQTQEHMRTCIHYTHACLHTAQVHDGRGLWVAGVWSCT